MKTLKKIIVNAVAVLMLATCAFSLTACEKIETLEVTVTSGESEYKMDIDLYCHLAPESCKQIIELVENNYYDGVVLYKIGSYDQIQIGDLKLTANGLEQNLVDGKLPSTVVGEFDKNGVVGSNLKNEEGSIGLWRSWNEEDSLNYKTSSVAMNSGRSTLYLPTKEITAYDGYFCILGQFDKEAKAYTEIKSAFDVETDYDTYTVFYTGEYDSEKPDENYGLKFNSMLKADYDALKKETVDGITTVTFADASTAKVFVAEGAELEIYNLTSYRVSKTVSIKSIIVK